MEYTKGKWNIEGNRIIAFGRGIVAICPSTKDGGVIDFLANIHLIAAAPEMYEALQLYISHQGGKRGHYCFICHNAIEKALAKAEGKAQ